MEDGFHVLNAATDAVRWHELILQFKRWIPVDDPMFSPEFMATEIGQGTDAMMAVYIFDDFAVMQPFVLRRTAIGDELAIDVTSARGAFGGPVSNQFRQLYLWFRKEFEAWCRDMGVATEFCDLNPLFGDTQADLVTTGNVALPWLRKSVVVIDTSTPDFTKSYHRRIKAALKNADAANVDVDHSLFSYGSALNRLYQAMHVRKAFPSRWSYTEDQISALCRLRSVYVAYWRREVCGAALVLADGTRAYYHLAALAEIDGYLPRNGAGAALVDRIARECHRAGIKTLHLGGGATSSPEDGVLRFKAGFSDLRLPVRSYFKVLDTRRYEYLRQAKIRAEVAATGREFTSGFVPFHLRES